MTARSSTALGQAARRRPLPPLAVKICGVRDVEGAQAVEAAGADFAGLLFVPGRRRSVDLERARAARACLARTQPVGVFLDAPLDEVEAVADALELQWIQLHGDEAPGYAQRLSQAGFRIIRALSLGSARPTRATFAEQEPFVEVFLLDGANPGSGTVVEASALPPDLGALSPRPVWLAGGLTPDNVAEKLRSTRAQGVDVASGVESRGTVDPERVRAFVARAREVRS